MPTNPDCRRALHSKRFHWSYLIPMILVGCFTLTAVFAVILPPIVITNSIPGAEALKDLLTSSENTVSLKEVSGELPLWRVCGSETPPHQVPDNSESFDFHFDFALPPIPSSVDGLTQQEKGLGRVFRMSYRLSREIGTTDFQITHRDQSYASIETTSIQPVMATEHSLTALIQALKNPAFFEKLKQTLSTSEAESTLVEVTVYSFESLGISSPIPELDHQLNLIWQNAGDVDGISQETWKVQLNLDGTPAAVSTWKD